MINKEDYTLEQWKQSCILRLNNKEDTTKEDWSMPVLDKNGYYIQDLAILWYDQLMLYQKDLELTDEQVVSALTKLEYIIDLFEGD